MKDRSLLISGDLNSAEDLKIVGPEIGNRLRILRSKNKMSQKSLSNTSNVPKDIISKIERSLKMITINQAKQLAKVLKVTPEFIIAGD